MSFLCPACHGALPEVTTRAVLPCAACGVAVDLRDVDTAPGAPGLSPERDLSGTSLGAYALTARLGSGGMGIVYAAEGPQGPAAVKVLARGPASDPGLRARFAREAEALLSIVHPAIVRVFAQGEQDGVAWYAMERGDGEDLARRLARGPLPAAEVEVLARQLLSALVLIHARGLVHRDIKPSNVLLFSSGAKLCDFGVARLDGTRTLTESMAVVGSLKYMAPEQRSGKTTAASDLYALGVLLFEARTGALPDELPLSVIEPRRLRRLIAAMLAVRPGERPSAEVTLAQLVAGAGGRGRAAVVAASVVAAALIVGVVVALRPWPGEPESGATVDRSALVERALDVAAPSTASIALAAVTATRAPSAVSEVAPPEAPVTASPAPPIGKPALPPIGKPGPQPKPPSKKPALEKKKPAKVVLPTEDVP